MAVNLWGGGFLSLPSYFPFLFPSPNLSIQFALTNGGYWLKAGPIVMSAEKM